MDLLTGVMYFLIGAVAGGLLALIADTYYLGQRLQKAIAAKRQMQSVLRRVERKLARAERRERQLAGELTMAAGHVETGEATETVNPLELERARADISTLKDNLNRVSKHADELYEERQLLREDLAAAKARVETARENYSRLDDELRELRQQYNETCKRLVAGEAARKHLEAELGFAREMVEKAGQMQLELQQLRHQLTAAEVGVSQQEARQGVDSAAVMAESLVEPTVHSPLPSVDDQPKPSTVAESVMEALPPGSETRTESSSARDNDSGKQNELEQVRGIGPVFARRLHAAGITGLADLAKQQPEQVSDVVGFNAGHNDRAAAWIEQARLLASN